MKKIKITGKKSAFEASYNSAGKLTGWKLIRGQLNKQLYIKLPSLIPHSLAELEQYKLEWPALVYSDATKTPPSQYGLYVANWCDFYYSVNGIRPKFGATDGHAIKGIMAYLESQHDEHHALATWQAMLQNWHRLPEFYRKKTDLTFINAKMNEIITHLTDGQSTAVQANRDAADLRSKI